MNSYLSGAMTNVGSIISGSRIVNNYTHAMPTAGALDACVVALRQARAEDERNNLIARGHQVAEGTCRWILDDSVFQKWKEQNLSHSLIWICEPPGSGKTALAIFISEHLEKSLGPDEDSWVLYYFCQGVEDRDTPLSILKGFLFQMYMKQKDLIHVIHHDYQYQVNTIFQPGLIPTLWRIFLEMISKSQARRIFCVIDGVDQCNEELKPFLATLSTYFKQQTKLSSGTKRENPEGISATGLRAPELRMLVLTREIPDLLLRELNAFPRLHLHSGALHKGKADVKRLVDFNASRISAKCSGGKKSSPEITASITKALDEKESPSFLWVSLISEKLMAMKQTQVKKYLVQLPQSVEGMHMQTLLDVPVPQRPYVSSILKWVSLAPNPLSTLELTKAVKYSVKTSFTKKSLNRALTLCSGLVKRQGKLVVLTHQSVQELLFHEKSPFRQKEELRDFVFTESETHSELANTCISYLEISVNMNKSRRVRLKSGDRISSTDDAFLRKHPFLQYAIVYWTFHARLGSLDKTNYDVPFFSDNSPRRKLWWESYWISLRQGLFSWKWTAPGNFSLLHLAAFFDIVPLAMYVEQKGRTQALVTAEDHQGMKPINWATERAQVAMVKFLLQHGEFDEEALRQAARAGENSIITMLLENKKHMRRKDYHARTPLSPSAPSSPLQAFRKVTLSSIADLSKKLNRQEDEGRSALSPDIQGYGKVKTETPLHIAATCGHDAAVETLVNAGENVHQTTDGGWTPLHNAAWFGRASIVELLVAAKADPEAVTKELLTPLHCAVKNSQPRVVECLLGKYGVHVDAKDQFGLTAFHMASKSGDIPVLEMLLKYNAHIDQKMRQGWTPLMWACMHGQFDVIHCLLRHGADVDAKWVQLSELNDKPIELGVAHLAKAYGHPEVVRLLDKHKATESSATRKTELGSLLPAVVEDEAYHLPETQDLILVSDEGLIRRSDLEDLQSQSSGESDCESGNESEPSVGESLPRPLLAVDLHENVQSGVQSQSSAFGLGIQENHGNSTDDKAGKSQNSDAIEGENTAYRREEEIGHPNPDTDILAADTDAGTHAGPTANTQNADIASVDRAIMDEQDNQETTRVMKDLQQGGFSRSSNSVVGRFGHFLPRKGRRASEYAISEAPQVHLEIQDQNVESVIDRKKTKEVAATPSDPDVNSTESNTSGLGRFRPKRMFSLTD